MILQVKKLILVICVLLVLTLSFCEAKNATVKVVGLLHCTDCFNNHSSSSNSSLGFDVFITCNAKKNETKTQGNGGVDKQGKFNVTLSAEIDQDASEIDGCYAKLQSRSGAPCHIQEPQSASVKILSNGEKELVINQRPTVIKFSPLTCQSAFFWPFPNLTFFGSTPPSPPEYIPPPSPENLPPLASPVQPPLPPPENSTPPPQPSYDPPLPPPEIEAPSPPPSGGRPAAAPPPTYQNPSDPEIESPSPPPQPLPTLPVYGKPLPATPLPAPAPPLTPPSPVPAPPLPPPSPVPAPPLSPPVKGPIQSPTPPATAIAPPTPALSSSPPPPRPSPKKSVPPPSSATIPGRRRPSPIPKAPPIPRLPLTPSKPRKYFNAPNSKSKPPHTV